MEYVRLWGYASYALLIGAIGAIVGWILDLNVDAPTLTIAWISLLIVIGLLAPFLTFHKLRIHRDKVEKQLKESLAPEHKKIKEKIAYLHGIERYVEKFFEGRNKQLDASEYMRVLGTQLMDARAHGLYDAQDFSEERAAMITATTAKDVAYNVFSIMARKRQSNKYSAEERPVMFQKYFLEDIKRQMEVYQQELGE